MPIDFPNPPLTVGQQYPYDGTTWQWNGYAWIVVGTYPSIGDYVTTFNGLTGAVTGVTTGTANTFVALQSFSAGISASGATLLSNTIIPSGSTLTVNGNFVANGNVNLGDAVTDAITVAGLLAANGGLSAAGGTFSALTRFTAGISAAGGTFSADIRVGSILLGNGFGGLTSNVAIGFNTLRTVSTGANNVAIGENALQLNTTGDLNTAIGQNALSNNTIGRYNIALGQNAMAANTAGEYCVAIGGGALLNMIGAGVRDNVAIGAGSAQATTVGSSNVSVGRSSLARLITGSNNTAIGYQSLLGAAGSNPFYCTSLGSNAMFSATNTLYTTAMGERALFSLSSGSYNTVAGAYGLYNITTQANNTAVGYNAGSYVGVTTSPLTNTSNSIYVGYQARGGAIGSSNEIVVGTNAVGFGSNSAVIGATTQTSATIYGLFNAPGGISASGGTFSGIINLNGQTFTNVVSTINGSSGSIGADSIPVGLTSTAITCVSFPSGITSFTSKIPYYMPCQMTNSPSSGTGRVSTNRVYFTLHNAPKEITLHTIRFPSFSTGITGNCFIGVYDVDINSGFPKNLLYSSTSITVASGAGSTSVTNASGLVKVPAGYFYIATIFDNTPSIYTLPSNIRPSFGSGAWTSGYVNYSIFSDPGGFTFPTSLPAAGITLGYIDYITGNTGSISGLYIEYRIV
jgi:hypothetical protein